MPNENEDNELIECISCSIGYESDDLYSTNDGDRVCSDCMRTCEHCEWVGHDNDEWHNVSDELWCVGCWENDSVYCSRCEYTYNGDRVGINNVRRVEEQVDLVDLQEHQVLQEHQDLQEQVDLVDLQEHQDLQELVDLVDLQEQVS